MTSPLTVFSLMPDEHKYNSKHITAVSKLVSDSYLQVMNKRAPRELHRFIDKGKTKKVKLRVYPAEFAPIIKNCVESYFKALEKK